MAVSITIPTPPGAGQRVDVALGKYVRSFNNAADAVDWASDLIGEGAGTRDLLFAMAILLAARRPAARGKVLTFDLTAGANILTVG